MQANAAICGGAEIRDRLNREQAGIAGDGTDGQGLGFVGRTRGHVAKVDGELAVPVIKKDVWNGADGRTIIHGGNGENETGGDVCKAIADGQRESGCSALVSEGNDGQSAIAARTIE